MKNSILLLFLLFTFFSCEEKRVSNFTVPQYPKKMLVLTSNLSQQGKEAKDALDNWVKQVNFKGTKTLVENIKDKKLTIEREEQKNKFIQTFQPDAILELYYYSIAQSRIENGQTVAINGGMMDATLGLPNQYTRVWMFETNTFKDSTFNNVPLSNDKIAEELFKKLTDKMVSDKILR
jgi:hypothetical protein